MMSLKDLEPFLPCHETLWEADIASLSGRLEDPKGVGFTELQLP